LLPFSFKWQPNIATTFHARRPQPSCWVLTGTFPFEFTRSVPPADGVSASLLHPPLPALPLKLVFVIERIHDQPAALTIESLPPLNHGKRRHG
jgi:hypothetical protein